MEYLQIIIVFVLLFMGGCAAYMGLRDLIGERITIILLDIFHLISGSPPSGDYNKNEYKTRSKKISKGLILLVVSFICFIVGFLVMESVT